MGTKNTKYFLNILTKENKKTEVISLGFFYYRFYMFWASDTNYLSAIFAQLSFRVAVRLNTR